MTIIRVGVQAVSAGAGQIVDFDASSVVLTSITNSSGVVVQYSTNSGGSWTSIAAGAVASIGVIVASTAFRLRLGDGGAYPAPVDVDFEGVQATAGSLSIISTVATGAEDFRGAKLRGMHTDTIQPDDPRSESYLDLFSRSRSNITRRFVLATAATADGPYVIPEGSYRTIDQDLAGFASRGTQTIIVINPIIGSADGNTSNTFWTSAGTRAAYILECANLIRRYKGDPRIAGITFLNEPFNAAEGATQLFTDKVLEFQEDAIDAGRAEDQTRTFIVTCAWAGTPGGYSQMRPVRQSNVVYEFHFYQPYAITHANVAGTADYSGTYPSPATRINFEFGVALPTSGGAPPTKDRMYQDLHAAIAFSQRYGVPMFVGEFACDRLVGPGVDTAWTKDAIEVIQEQGWSWMHFGFFFTPSPWDCFTLPSSAFDVDYNSGAGPDQEPLNTFTKGSTRGRVPFAVVADALSDNSLYRDAAPKPTAVVFETETFEATLGRLATASVSAGGTAVFDSTARPKTGTKHARFTHVSGAGYQQARAVLTDNGQGKDEKEVFFSADVNLGAAITGGSDLVLLELSAFGSGSGNFVRVRNVTGTSNWVVDIWKGSGDYGTRPIINADDLVITPGTYTRLKMGVLKDQFNGRVRLWQDANLLVDINGFPTSSLVGDQIWAPVYGLIESNQIGQFVDFDNIRFSAAADLT